MRWRYRTILFEFHKDKVFGEKYIDEEEIENSLNEHGAAGWELVNVSPLREGLLAFCKKPQRHEHVRSSDGEFIEDSGMKTVNVQRKFAPPAVVNDSPHGSGERSRPIISQDLQDISQPEELDMDSIDDIPIR